jgi:ribosomal protein S18 acetylase RimI-like enzyme
LIRIVEKQDDHVSTLRTIFLNERKRTFHWLDTSQYRLEDFDKETEGEHVYVAIENGQPIGFISIWLPDHFIHHLYISYAHARRGIGRLLIAHVLTNITKNVTLKCFVRNESAIQFYIALGFREIQRGMFENEEYILYRLE